MHIHLTLGNQLFDIDFIIRNSGGKVPHLVYMREDWELCTHFKYHKHKIIFFLAAMRKYQLELQRAGISVWYEKIEDTIAKGKLGEKFETAFLNFLSRQDAKQISFFEIEDKFFETRILSSCRQIGIQVSIYPSPMFLNSREDFQNYVQSTKKPFMKNYYQRQRKKWGVLVDQEGLPVGGQWSFDEENRKRLPKNYAPPQVAKASLNEIDSEVTVLVNQFFPDHIGEGKTFWYATDRAGAKKWCQDFIKHRLTDFGAYEDALSSQFDVINHSVLTPYLNCGLLTPREVIRLIYQEYQSNPQTPLSSVEGFIRQVMGWREFIRGIYQTYSEQQACSNFFNHHRKLTIHWYEGATGIPPLDEVIKKVVRLSYAHHIERLMVLGSLMLILEIDPLEAYRYFMEMFIDSSDWVMGPNVFGMALFSDGGIFATKPYFCSANYYHKMGTYPKGDWETALSGLYWKFVEKNQEYFMKNHRLSMTVKTLHKMDPKKKSDLFTAGEELKNNITKLY